MKDKILNFPDAMRLAQLILKYFDTVSIKEMTGERFGHEFFSVLEVEEISEVANFLLGEQVKTITPEKAIYQCVREMIKNDLLKLLEIYKNLGLK